MAHDPGKNFRVLGLMIQGDIGPMTFYTSARGKSVSFLRAPPLNPPTPLQETIRDLFRNAATQWRALTQAQRTDWRRLATAANLGISGWNLYTWYYWTRNQPTLAAMQRNTKITVVTPS